MVELLVSLAVVFAGGVGSLLLRRWPSLALWCGALGVVAGAALGLKPTVEVLLGAPALGFSGPWPMPNGAFLVELDALSAFFLAPILVLGAVGGLYGGAYLGTSSRSALAVAAFNVLVASMALVVIARNGVLFLVAWEAMAVTAFFLVAFDHHEAESRRAGWVYLIATHIGAAALFAMFLLLARTAGSYDFTAFVATPPTGLRAGVVAVLAIIGFGAKAGFFPLHVWLPEAHAAAPSHVSALMSGALIKLGLYGMLRVFLMLGPTQRWWGTTLAVIGLAGAAAAISSALYQRDLKRVLAYSSVENVGLITLALGLAWEAQATGAPAVAVIALAGALLHVWNHALMKGTMFLAAGSLVHATHTRDLEKLGGLMRTMPLTGLGVTVGALALSALPPLNGFVSEWLIYQGLLQRGLGSTGVASLAPLIGVGVVGLIGGLTALTFARLWGVALLGSPRSPAASHAHESPRGVTVPILILAGGCLVAALVPALLLRPAATVGAQLLHLEPSAFLEISSVGNIAAANAALWVVLGLGGLAFFALLRRRSIAAAETWGCGYPRPTSRMQYSGLSFGEIVSEHVLPGWFRPVVQRKALANLFAEPGELGAVTSDPITRKVYEPLLARFAGRLSSFTWLQTGALHNYLLYVLLAVLAGMGWLFVRTWVLP